MSALPKPAENPAPSAPSSGYRRDIDGLRAVAVAAVVAFHAAPELAPGGFVGVDVFFVISGFLISGVLFAELDRTGSLGFGNFYRRRIQRIFPALALVLAAGLAMGWLSLFAEEYEQLGKHVAGGVGFATNFVLWSEAGYFDSASAAKPFLHLWSLGIEEQFYLVFPALLFLARRSRKLTVALVAATALLSFAANLALTGPEPTEAFFLPHTRMWELLLGTLAAAVGRLQRPPRVLSVLGLLAVLGSIFLLDGSVAWPGGFALLPTLGAVAILLGGEGAALNRWFLGNRVAVGIGLISYPLYLWHWLLLSFAHILAAGEETAVHRGAAVGLSVLFSILTYFFVEKPIRFGRKTLWKPVGLGVAMALLGGAGLHVFLREGFPERSFNPATIGNEEFKRTLKGVRNRSQGLFEGEGSHAYYSRTSRKPVLALVGDSHAIAAYSPFYLKQLRTPSLLLAKTHCFPFTGFTMKEKGGKDRACGAFTSEALKRIEKTPTIRFVALFKWPGDHLGSSVVNGVATFRDGVTFQPTEPGHNRATMADYYFDGFDRLISDIEAMGKTAVFVIDNPDLKFSPKECLHRPFSLAEQEYRDPCGEDRQGLAKQAAPYRAVVERLRAKHPALLVVDSWPLFCDDATCFARRDEIFLYFDRNHLNRVGAERLDRVLLEQAGLHP